MSRTFLTRVPFRELVRLSGLKRYKDNGKSRHRLAMSVYPQIEANDVRERFKVLFRFERTSKDAFFLIRSIIPPTALNEIQTLEENYDSLKGGDYIIFRTTASTVTRNRSTETPITSAEDQEEWLKQAVGKALTEVDVQSSLTEVIQRDKGGKSKLQLTQFDGVARIVDLPHLNQLILNGFGRNKNYGAGLFTLRKINV